MKRSIAVASLAFGSIAFLVHNTLACTTFCLRNDGEVIFGKNYDWNIGHGLIFVNKRGVEKHSTDEKNPKKWTSRYGSVTFNQYGRENPSGGMNEAGLVIELMWLDDTQYPKADARPVVGVLEWIQLNLDAHASVAEVIKSANDVRISSDVKIHYLVSDKTGQVATIEFLDGNLAAHTGNDLPVAALTNDTYVRSLKFAAATEASKTPGVMSLNRFVRASEKTREFGTKRLAGKHAVDYAFETLANVAQPGYTQWSIVYDQKRSRIYFRTLQNPQIRSIDTLSFDYSCASPVRMLDVNARLSGDVARQFAAYTRSANRDLIERSFTGTEFLRSVPAAAKDELSAYAEKFPCSLPATSRPSAFLLESFPNIWTTASLPVTATSLFS